MNVKRAHIAGEFWLLWVFTHAVGWAMGFPVEGDLLWSPGWLVAGVVTGTLQAFLLWRYLPQNELWKGWMLASIAGGTASALMLGTITDGLPDMAVLGLMIAAGLPVGTLQWLALRRYRAGAALWTVAHSLGIGMAVAVILGISVAVGYVGHVAADILMGGVFGVVYGAVTGSMLVWLLHQALTKGSSLVQKAA